MISFTKIIFSDNIEESIRFYECLGFQIYKDNRQKGGNEASVIYSGTPDLILNFYSSKDRLDYSGYDSFLTFTVENVDEKMDFFKERGYPIDDVQDIPFGKFAYLKDPFGYQVIISELYV